MKRRAIVDLPMPGGPFKCTNLGATLGIIDTQGSSMNEPDGAILREWVRITRTRSRFRPLRSDGAAIVGKATTGASRIWARRTVSNDAKASVDPARTAATLTASRRGP